jgi:hypothetical protein
MYMLGQVRPDCCRLGHAGPVISVRPCYVRLLQGPSG